MKKIGLIGAGRWSTPYALSAKHVDTEIVGIYAPDTSAAKLADRIGARTIDDPRKVIEMCECILIGSPTDTHADYLKMAADAGTPALCASPIVADADQIEKFHAVTSEAQAYASFPLRARPEYRRLKEALSAGDLGATGMFRLGICRPRPTGWRAETERSGGILLETGVHLLDCLQWLAGPIERIYGASSKPGENQYSVLVARMADGSIAHLEISWVESDGVSYDYYEVAGSEGLLEYDSRREPLLAVDYHDDRPTDILSPGSTAAEHELRALLKILDGTDKGEGNVAGLDHGLEICRMAVQLGHAISAGEVLVL